MTTATSSKPPGRPGGSRGADLLAIARDVFLAQQYAGTTMDAVAARARISKQTLYRQYSSKDALYAAVVRDWVDRGRDAMSPHLRALMQTDEIRHGLLEMARTLHFGVLSRPVLQMRRLIAAEAERFPTVAADYVRRSWDHNQALLAEALEHLAARGLLRIDSAGVAAEQFTWLTLAAPLNRLTLTAGAGNYPPEELEAIANAAVTTFLHRYGPDRRPDTTVTSGLPKPSMRYDIRQDVGAVRLRSRKPSTSRSMKAGPERSDDEDELAGSGPRWSFQGWRPT